MQCCTIKETAKLIKDAVCCSLNEFITPQMCALRKNKKVAYIIRLNIFLIKSLSVVKRKIHLYKKLFILSAFIFNAYLKICTSWIIRLKKATLVSK